MKKVLIFGVNGFIGHDLTKRILADTDWQLFGMDMASGRVSELSPSPIPRPCSSGPKTGCMRATCSTWTPVPVFLMKKPFMPE